MKFFSKLTARQSTITSLKHWRHFKKTQMFNYCASDHTFILGCRPKERRKKKKARDLQLKSYKVVNFTLEQNYLQWQISKAICMRFSWKADDPKFLCLTGSDLPHRRSRFFSCRSPLFIVLLQISLSSTTIRILEMLFNAGAHFINTAPSSIFKAITSGAKLSMENV